MADEMVWNWRELSAEERAELQVVLDGQEWQAIHAGGSLHVDEYHIVLGDTVYRFFLLCSKSADAFGPDTPIEQGWQTPAKGGLRSPGISDEQARIHMDICRDGDKFADAIQRIEIDAGVRGELVNQIVAMQRLAMRLNVPGRNLSPSKLNRF